jgi:hypothetical protein
VRLEGGGGNRQGVNKEGEDWRREKRAAMVAQVVGVRRRETRTAAALVLIGGRGRVGSWAELGR